MPSTVRNGDDRDRLSRRTVVKGGIYAAAGALATMISTKAGADAVTPLDVKRNARVQQGTIDRLRTIVGGMTVSKD